MIVKVGVPTMTYADLLEVLADLAARFDNPHELDNVPIQLASPESGLTNLRTIKVKDNHSDYTDGSNSHRVIILDNEAPY